MLDKQQQEQLLDLFTDITTLAKETNTPRDTIFYKVKNQLVENQDYFFKGVQIIIYKFAVKKLFPDLEYNYTIEDLSSLLYLHKEVLSLEEVSRVLNKPLNTVKSARKRFVNKTIAGMCLTTLSGVLEAYTPKCTSYHIKLISPLLKKHSTEHTPGVYVYLTQDLQFNVTDLIEDIPHGADMLLLGGILPTQGNYKERMNELKGIVNSWIKETIQIHYIDYISL